MLELTERLIRLFGTEGCFFVEAGAHDGVGDSQTLELERAGWDGICVEPSSAYHGLKASRRCRTSNVVLLDRCGTTEFREVGAGNVELSGVSEHFKADGWDRERGASHVTHHNKPCSTLDDLLATLGAPPVIQFLSLDTEGSELAIWSAHDQDGGCRILSVQIEHNGVPEYETAIGDCFLRRGYELRQRDRVNDFWLLPKERW